MKKIIKNMVRYLFVFFVCIQVLFFVGCQKEYTIEELNLLMDEISEEMMNNEYPGIVSADIDYEKLKIIVTVNENHQDKDQTIDKLQIKYGDAIEIVVGDYYAVTT